MKIKLFGYIISGSITKDLVDATERLARSYPTYGNSPLATKIARVKAYRTLTNSKLYEAKEWVESNLA